MVGLIARQRLSWLQQPHKVIDEEMESSDGRYSSSSDDPINMDRTINPNQNTTTIESTNRSLDKKNANTRAWPRLFAPKKRDVGSGGDWIPSVSGLIKAGDEGVYTSALFHQLHEQTSSDDLCLDAVYELFANQLRTRPIRERSAYPSEITKFLASSKKVQRSKSLRVSREIRRSATNPTPSKGPRSSMDLSEVTLSISRSLSKKSSSSTSIDSITPTAFSPNHSLWSQDMQQLPPASTMSSLTVTTAELAVLSLILGSPTSPASTQRKAFYKGAYGLTLSYTPLPDGKHHTITLHAHSLRIPQRPAPRAAVTSTLHAKHMACNCLPFFPSPTTTSSPSTQLPTAPTIQLTPATLTALLTKSPLPYPSSSPSKIYLTSLPHARAPNFPKYTLPDLLHSIASLPFSTSPGAAANLPPLAGATLVDTIALVASGGKSAGRLAQRLEALVDKVAMFCSTHDAPASTTFGALYDERNVGILFRERERLGHMEANHFAEQTPEEEEEAMVTRTSRTTRWIAMLDRLVGMLDTHSPTSSTSPKKLAKVLDATFHDLLDAYNSFLPSALPPSPPLTPTKLSPSTHERRQEWTLAKDVESLLQSPLPFSSSQVARVARCVLVAWCVDAVERVEWVEEDGEAEGGKGVRLDGFGIC